MGKSIESTSETRNSKLRSITAGTIERITISLHGTFPKLTANDITILGVVGTAVGSTLAAVRRNDSGSEDKVLTAASLTTTIASQLTDAFDGSMARLRISEGGVPNPKGPLLDAASDRISELLMAFSRAVSAEKRHDKIGTFAALTTAVTSSWPSMARASAEVEGIAVPETGRGIIGLLGTRAGRAFLGILGMEFPEIHGVPVQVIADTLASTASIITTAQRLNVPKNNPATLSEEIQNDAKKRFKVLAAIGIISVATAGTTYLLLHKKK